MTSCVSSTGIRNNMRRINLVRVKHAHEALDNKNYNGTYNHLSASSPLSSSCSVCAVSTARPEESRGSDCGTGRGLAYTAQLISLIVLREHSMENYYYRSNLILVITGES